MLDGHGQIYGPSLFLIFGREGERREQGIPIYRVAQKK